MWGDNHQLRLGEFVASVITELEAKTRYITKTVSCGVVLFAHTFLPSSRNGEARISTPRQIMRSEKRRAAGAAMKL